MFTTIFFTLVIMIPIYCLLIWTYYYPEESMLLGKRWMYKEEPEISSSAIRYTKFASITAMIGLPVVVLSLILEIYVLRLVWVVFPLVIVLGAIKIFTDNKD
ncbi:hypothetical protein [Pseudoneobacillus sp. C159]